MIKFFTIRIGRIASMSFPFISMTGGVSLTTNYAGNASMGAGRASGRL